MSHTYEETVHVKQFWSGTLVDLITREQALRIWEQQPEEYRTEHAEVYRKFFDIP
jgi:LmbE family N-acetylglucosaminyl deacetylase